MASSHASGQDSLYSYDSSGNLAARATEVVTPPQITAQPVMQVADPGDLVSYSVVLADARGTTFQWLFNGTNIGGANGDSLLLTNISGANKGQYSVVVSNSAGSITSSIASLVFDKYWNGSVDGNWFNPANWTPAGVPAAEDTVNFDSGTITLTAPLTITSRFNWTGGSLRGSPFIIASNALVNLSGSSPKYLLSPLTNSGTIIWGGTGDFNVRNDDCFVGDAGAIENLAGALLDIQSDRTMADDLGCQNVNPYLRNAGTVRKSSGTGTTTLGVAFYNTGTVIALQGTLNCANGGTIEGAFNAAARATISFSAGNFKNANPAVITGPGVVQTTGGNFALFSDAIPNLPLSAGTVSLGGNFQGGTITNLALAGALLNGNYILSGTLDWSAGAILGSLTVTSNALVNLSGSSPKYLRSPLTNSGTIIWGGTGDFNVRNDSCFGDTGAIENLAGALLDIQSDQTMATDFRCGNFNPYVRNAGTVRKSSGTGTTTLAVALYNTGTVIVLQGTLNCANGGTIEGAFNAAAGATINFSSGHFISGNSTVINGPGAVQFLGDNLTLLTDAIPNLPLVAGTVSLGPNFQGGTITNLALAGVSLTGNNILSGTLNWSAGAVLGSLTVTSNALVNLSGSAPKFLLSPLTNSGTIIWGGTGDFNVRNDSCFGDTGAIENLAGALLDIQSDRTMATDFRCGNFNPYLRNAGTVRKSSGTGTTTLAVACYNTGTVIALQGTLNCANGGTIEGAFNAAAGATISFSAGGFNSANPAVATGPGVIQFTGDTLTMASNTIPNLLMIGGLVNLGPSFQGGTITDLTLAGSSLSGSHTVSGKLNWGGGGIVGPLTVTSGGWLNLNGSADKILLNPLTNSGTITWGGTGNFIVRSTSCYGVFGAIDNLAGGVFDIQSDQTMFNDFNCGSATPYLHNVGTIRKSYGMGTTTISIPFINSNSLAVLQGKLSLGGQNYAPGNSSFLVTLGGTVPGQFGQLICGAATLGGSLNVSLSPSFIPGLGAQFQILASSSQVGSFTRLNVPQGIDVSYGNNGVFLAVTGAVPPRILSPQVSQGNFIFSLPTANGQSYTLQTNTDLASGNWGLFTNFMGDDTVRQFAVPMTNAGPRLFLRVSLP